MLRFKEFYSIPFNEDIPNGIQAYKASNSFFIGYIKFIKRFLYLFLRGQAKLKSNKISESVNKILWINISAPSLGDSIMDLSSRYLLKKFKIDLLTSKKNAFLYKHDSSFNSVFTEENNTINGGYDLVILDSYSSRTINLKKKISPNSPYVSMFGYFNGPEVNRVLYSFHRMNQLLSYPYKASEINALAKPFFFNSSSFIHEVFSKEYLCFVIGGEWKYRTYNNWKVVIKNALELYQNLHICLVGSENGHNYAKEIMATSNNKQISNFVGKLSFFDTAEVIKNSKIVLCSDGGLMHVSNSFLIPTVALFARLKPEMRFTDSSNSFACFDYQDVNNIPPESVIKKLNFTINLYYKHLLDE